MDLPTYTNIWRIEKRLYKLYDFRLPAPLPITWIAVFVGITVPYIFFLVVIGLPFNHNLVWLYVLPPGVLTWLTTRPVIESKRLPELVGSQLRYLSEPRTWARMTPLAEKDDVYVTVRVWHRRPPRSRPKKQRKAAARDRSAGRALTTAESPALLVPSAAQGAAASRTAAPQSAAPQSAARQAAAPEATGSQAAASQAGTRPRTQSAKPALSRPARSTSRPRRDQSTAPAPGAPLQVPQRAMDRPEPKHVRVLRGWQREPEPDERPSAPADQAPPGVIQQRPSWAVPPADRRQDSRTLEVSHDPEPDPRDLGQAGPASFAPPVWPQVGGGVFPPIAAPEVAPFPEVGAFPEVDPFPEDEALAEPEPDLAPLSGAAPESESEPEPEPFPAVEADLVEPEAEVNAQPEPEPGPEPLAFPETEAAPLSAAKAFPAASAFPEAGAFPEVAPLPEPGSGSDPGVMLELEPLPEPDPAPASRPGLRPSATPAPDPAPVSSVSAAPGRAPAATGRSVAARVASLFVDLEAGDRPVPSVERALSGPGSVTDPTWRRRVKVVTGGQGQGPGQRDQAAQDRERARLPLDGPRRIAVLGCTSGAGQSVISLMTGQVLAVARAVPVAVLDLNPGEGSLAARIEPVTSVAALLAGRGPSPYPAQPRGRGRARGRLDVIGGDDARALHGGDYQRLAGLLAERYPLTIIDPAPSGLTRVLELADQLVLVAPASPEAATALAHTQQWLAAHGYDELAVRAVTVVNGVSRRSMDDVHRAESVARGRCRAIVRMPWDDLLSAGTESPAGLHPQTRLAFTALAGVLVAGLARTGDRTGHRQETSEQTRVRERSPGEHAD